MPSHRIDTALAADMLNMAVRSAAQAQYYGDSDRILAEIHKGNCEACAAVSDCLARQLGAYLGGLDHSVKAAFRYEPEYATLRHVQTAEALPLHRSGINLVLWVEKKTTTFGSAGPVLESLLSAQRRKTLACPSARPACYVLDVQLVDDRDVQENRGLALAANSLYLRSVQVWKRREDASFNDNGTPAGAHGMRPDGLRPGKGTAPLKELVARIAITDPEAMTEEELFSQAQAIEKLPSQERPALEPRLQEIKVALIRRLLSDQPSYIRFAREFLTLADLAEVVRRKIGGGRIGGEAAGLVLTARILRKTLQEPLRSSVQIPESYYLGADLFYTYMALNRLMRWNYQKYKPDEQIRGEYPLIRESFLNGEFPPEILHELRGLLNHIGQRPLIVRSSSLLEDSFGAASAGAFAGKYDFILCPNQGGPEQNLKEFGRAIASVYASTLRPEALLYRRIRGLRDYDERMGVLIQPVQGERLGRYLLPTASGVALSRNLYRWSPQIRSEDGFVRMVWGLGTSAVERAGNNPPRLVALSHPAQQAADPTRKGPSYRQHRVDVIDLQENCFKTLPVIEVLSPEYAPIRLIAQRREQDYYASLRGPVLQADIPDLVVTLDEFLRRTDFAPVLSELLRTLESAFHSPVDLGFTAQVVDPDEHEPQVTLTLLHCRKQDYLAGGPPGSPPPDLPPEKILFRSTFMVPRGRVKGIRHVLFVTPEVFDRLPDEASRSELRLAIFQLNTLLGEKQYILLGPGQWGAANPRLGVDISYAELYNAAALVELYGGGAGARPDPALGTYAFQDLMEAHIYPLTVSLEGPGGLAGQVNAAFLYDAPNRLAEVLPSLPGGAAPSPNLLACLRLISVADFAPGCHLEIVMDDEQSQAVAFLVDGIPD